MDKPDNRKVRQRTEMEVELERWKMRAISAEAKLEHVKKLVDKHLGYES